MSKSTKLNLGSGRDYRPGYVNIDAMPNIGADMVMDITAKLPFLENSIEEIIAQDILEHLTFEQQRQTMKEIARVLKQDGKLIARIPNIDEIVRRFENDKEVRNLFLYGDTSQTGVWGSHKSGHTVDSFSRLALSAGLKVTKVIQDDTNYIFEFKKTKPLEIQNITFFNQTMGIGGAEAFNADLLAWLKSQGINITAYSNNQKFLDQLQPREINSQKFPIVVDLIGDWKGLVKGIIFFIPAWIYYSVLVWQNRQTDVIVMTGFIEKILVTPIAYLLKIPVVWVEFGPFQNLLNKFFRFPKLLYLLVKSLPFAVIVPTRNTMRHLVPYAHVSSAKIRIIPCARQLSKYSTSSVLSACCVSRLEKGKGQDLLIKAWQEVVGIFPKAKLKIVGEGSEKDNLNSLISKLSLQANIELTGWVKDPLRIMSESQVCVFPSHWEYEGFGLVAIEAMSLAKPVVGFDIGPLPEIVDASTGMLVGVDEHKLAQAIINLLKNPQLAKQLGAAGRQKFTNNFTFSQVGQDYLAVIKEAVAERRVNEILETA